MEKPFKHSIFINPLGFALAETRYDTFPVPAPAISYERHLRPVSLYVESNIHFILPLNIEMGVIKYFSDTQEGFFMSIGFEYWWGDFDYYVFGPDFAIRTPVNVGYRWIFDSGFSIKIFGGTGIMWYERQIWGSDGSWRLEKFFYPDFINVAGIQLGYSW